MLWNDSINNEEDLSCSNRLNLHFKARKDTSTQRDEKTGINLPQLKCSPRGRRDTPPLPNTHIARWIALCFTALWCHRRHNPCHSAPAHAEVAEQRAVKGGCGVSLGGIKDVERHRAFPAASISLWVGLKFSLPNKRSREGSMWI